jgi:hypothetical protein
MAFEEVKGDGGERKEAEFFPYKGMAAGFFIEGFYKGKATKQSQTKAGKPAFNEDGSPKMFSMYFFDQQKWEKSKALYGTGKLNYLLSKVNVGDYVKVTYQGKEEVDGYLQPLHQFKLEVDPTKRQMVNVEESQTDFSDAPPIDDDSGIPF